METFGPALLAVLKLVPDVKKVLNIIATLLSEQQIKNNIWKEFLDRTKNGSVAEKDQH